MKQHTPGQLISFLATLFLLGVLISCKVEEELPTPTSTNTPAPTQTFAPTFTPTPTPLPEEIQYLRDNPHAGPIPDGAVAALGRGAIADVAYAPQSQQMVIASSIGLFIYQAPEFELIHFEPLHIGFNSEIEFSPGGSFMTIHTEDIGVVLIDSRNWESIPWLQSLQDDNNYKDLDLQFSANDEYLSVVVKFNSQPERSFKLFDLEKRDEVASLVGNYSLNRAAFSPDATLLAVGVQNVVQVINTETGEIFESPHILRNWDEIKFSEDGQYLASSSLARFTVIELTNPMPSDQFVIEQKSNIVDLAFSRDESMLFVYVSGEFQIWDIKARQQLSATKLTLGDRRIVIDPDMDHQIILSSEQNFYALNIADKHAPEIIAKTPVEFPEDASSDIVEGETIRFQAWNTGSEVGFTDLATNETVSLKESRFGFISGGLLSGSNYMVVWSASRLTLWDLPNEEPLKVFDGFSSRFTMDILPVPAKNMLVTIGSNDNVVTVWDVRTGSIVQSFSSKDISSHYFSWTSVVDKFRVRVINPIMIDPSTVEMYLTYLWDLNEDWLPIPLVENDDLSAETTAPEDRNLVLWFIADPFQEGNFTLWDLDSRTIISTLDVQPDDWNTVGLSNDKTKLFLANSDRVVTIDVETGQLIRSVNLQHSMTPNEIFLYSSWLITKAGLLTTISRGEDGSRWLLIWDIHTGQLVDQFRLNLLNGVIDDQVVLSDDCILVSEIAYGSYGESDAVVWNIITKEKIVFPHDSGGNVLHAIFVPEEDLFITNTSSGPIYFWPFPQLCP